MQTETLGVNHDADYQVFKDAVTASLASTDSTDALCVAQIDYMQLWNVYLDSIPAEYRQHYNCNTCRRFFKHYGGLVLVDEHGRKRSAVWAPDVKGMFGPIAAQMAEVVQNAVIKSVFATDNPVCGSAQTQESGLGRTWTHYALVLPQTRVNATPLEGAGRVRAKSIEAAVNVSQIYQKIETQTIKTALTLVTQGRLNRAAPCQASLEWLLGLYSGSGITLNARTWYGVAKNPALLHLSGSALGQLLKDLQAGKTSVDQAVNAYNDRTGTKYRVATVAPKVGNVLNATRIVSTLGVDASLKRRYAKVEELQKLWEARPQAPTAGTGGVFGGVVVRAPAVTSGPVPTTPVRMTWQKFAQTLLPSAAKIQFRVRQDRVSCHWGAFTAPLAANDPPIFAWDDPNNRNPYGFFAWTSRDDGPKIVGLRDGQTADVTAVAYTPPLWNNGTWGHDRGVVFTLDGARFQADWGMALFPAELRAELQPARATITAFSKANHLADRADATAVGFYLQNRTTTPKGTPFVQEAHLSVYTNVGAQYVIIDRWD